MDDKAKHLFTDVARAWELIDWVLNFVILYDEKLNSSWFKRMGFQRVS